MSVFLKFLFNEENLAQWLRPEWLKLYDPAYVDEQLIGKCVIFVKDVEKLRTVMEGQMAAEAAKKDRLERPRFFMCYSNFKMTLQTLLRKPLLDKYRTSVSVRFVRDCERALRPWAR